MDKLNYDDIGGELYEVLAQVLNRPGNRKFLDSIRGEYGVLCYLLKNTNPVNAGELREKLYVVPGRMTDILNSLETKGFIRRERDELDKRVVNVFITDSGRREAETKRSQIHSEYAGLFELIGYEETKELIRLLKILLTYSK